MNPEMMAIELRAERDRLIANQRGLAATINTYYPCPVDQPRSAGELAACAQAERNTQRIAEIDRDLTVLSAPDETLT